MTKAKVWMLAALMFHGALSFAQSDDTGNAKEITPQELAGLLQAGHVAVIDVNEGDNYAEAHVPGAKRMDYDALVPDSLPAEKTTTLVFYCWSPECPAACTAANSAAELGYTDARCMKAGITGWQDAGLPTAP